MDHIDHQSAALADRERPQVANHIRTTHVQMLDALLRIEELLQKQAQPPEQAQPPVATAAGTPASTKLEAKPKVTRKSTSS